MEKLSGLMKNLWKGDKKTNTPRRRLTISGPESLQKATSQRGLLSLPAEIRAMIWDLVFDHKFIAIYSNDGRLTHTILNATNSRTPPEGFYSHMELIKKYENSISTPPMNQRKEPLNQKKLKTLAFMQTCRLIYSDCIPFLYSKNSFLFLQNHALRQFHDAVLPERFQSIRSVHIQWQCFQMADGLTETEDGGEAFPEPLYLLRNNPHLDVVSLFISGQLFSKSVHQGVISDLAKVQKSWKAPAPKAFVLRLPFQSEDQSVSQDELDKMIVKPAPPFQMVNPTYAPYGEQLDASGGDGFGWRYGVHFLPSEESGAGGLEYTMRTYFIWTGREQETKDRGLYSLTWRY